MSERRLIYILLCCGCVTISFNVAAISAAIPAISKDLLLADVAVAKIIPFYMIPYGLGALLYAPMTRKSSYRRILSIPIMLYALSSLFCAKVSSLSALLLGRIGMGVAGASAIPLGLLIIGQLFEKDVRGRLVGLFFSCSFIASLAGIVVSGTAHWRWLFYIPALLGLMTGIGWLLLPTDLLNRIHGIKVNYLQTFKDKNIREIFIFIFWVSFFYHGVHKWFGVYLDRVYSFDQFTISIYFLIMTVFGMAGQMIGGVISDKIGRYWACLSGILILSTAIMLLVGIYPYVLLAFILGLISLGWTVGHNGISTVLTDFPERHRPVIASLNSSVRFVSGGIGFFVSSLFIEKSFGFSFLAFGLCLFVMSFFLKFLIKE